MLLSEWVEVKLNPMNIKYYEDLGYEIPRVKTKKNKLQVLRGTKLLVKVEDLQNNSHTYVDVLCDYCLENGIQTIVKKEWKTYLSRKNNDIIKKDCCDKCKNCKIKESNIKVYGESNTFLVNEYKEKSINTIIDKYNCDNVLKNENIKNKIKQTNLIKYGCINPMQNNEIQQKMFKTNLHKYGAKYVMQNYKILEKSKITLYKNQTYQCSKQQLYLQKLFGGELNYPIGKLSLDIAFPNKMIYIEYNGGGHNLQVKFDNISTEEFNQKEIKRYLYLKSLGWKCIKITSNKDYLPLDRILLNEFNNALEWFKSNDEGHWHYNIDIGNKVNDEKYGKLRKITEKDLEEVS